jgi:hypothetical protein
MNAIVQSSLTKIKHYVQILIKEGYFNLSTMLNLKEPMDVPYTSAPKPEHTT